MLMYTRIRHVQGIYDPKMLDSNIYDLILNFSMTYQKSYNFMTKYLYRMPFSSEKY